jgi:hypothetical protein
MTEEQQIAPKTGTQSPVLRFLANLVSYVFHPLFMPLIMSIVLYRLAASNLAGITMKVYSFKVINIFVSTLLLPLVTVLLLKGLGLLKSLKMPDPRDRIIPLIVTMTFTFWVYLVFKNTKEPLILRSFMLGNFLGITGLFLATIFYKVSMHTAAAGGVLGLMLVLMIMSPVSMFIPILIAIIIAGVIGTARLLLGAHTPFEIWAGYLLGLLAQVGAYFFLA